jgi:hypothetical protein
MLSILGYQTVSVKFYGMDVASLAVPDVSASRSASPCFNVPSMPIAKQPEGGTACQGPGGKEGSTTVTSFYDDADGHEHSRRHA